MKTQIQIFLKSKVLSLLMMIGALALMSNSLSAQTKRLLYARTIPSAAPQDLINSYAVSKGWTSTACTLGAPATTLTAISGQTFPGGFVLTKANYDGLIFGTLYNTIDPTYITAIINFMNEGGKVYFCIDGDNTPDLFYASQINQLLTAATGTTTTVTEGIDGLNGVVSETPFRNVGGVKTSAAPCAGSTNSNYQTGTYLNSSTIPDNILYYEYASNRANLLFTKTVNNGVLGISTEYFTSGSSGGTNGPTAGSAIVQNIYENVFGSQLTSTGICQGDVGITKTVNSGTKVVGGNAVFTLTATNNGLLTATTVSITDILPAGFTYVSHTAPTAGTFTYTVGTKTGVWNIASFSAGGSASMTITAQVNASGSYTNTATITSGSTDGDATNNSSSVTVPVCSAGTTQVPLTGTTLTNTCPATTVNLNDLYSGTAPGVSTLVWFTNAAHTGTAYATPTMATAGTYYAFFYDAVANCYNTASSTSSVVVTIYTTLAQPGAITGPTNQCLPATNQMYSISAVAGATSYNWTYSGSGVTITGNGTTSVNISFANGATAGTLSVVATSLCTTGPARTLAITIGTPPVISSVAVVNASTCSGTNGSIALNGLTNGVSYTINYQKNGVAQTAVVQVAASNRVTLSTLGAGSYTNITVRANNCTSAAVSATIADSCVSASICSANSLLYLGGNASIVPAGYIRLTPNSVEQYGQAWTSATQSLNNNFIIRYKAYFGASNVPGADGMAFVLRGASTGTTVVGRTGGGLGYGLIVPSIAVEFDTYDNGTEMNAPYSGIPTGDTSDDHTVVHVGGNWTQNGRIGNNVSIGNGGNIEDGRWHDIEIRWNATSKTLDTYFEGVLKNSVTRDFVALDFGGNPNVIAGYTASTGGQSNEHAVCIQAISNCNAGIDQVPLTSGALANSCTSSTVNLNSLYTGTAPSTPGLVWFTNNAHTGSPYATPATAGAGTYYAFFYDAANNCYNAVTSTSSVVVTINTYSEISGTTNTNPTTCGGSNGSIVLNGLSPNTNYTVNYNKDGVVQTAFSQTSTAGGLITISGLTVGAYSNITVTNLSCTSAPVSATLTNPAAPSAPTIGTITQPTCAVQTGSVALTGLPAGSWTITTLPATVSTNGSGATTNISGLPADTTYKFIVTDNTTTCSSAASADVIINAAPLPATTPGAITGPTCILAPQSSQIYSVPAVPGATTYTWSYNPPLPGGSGVITGQGTNSITMNFIEANPSGTLSVTVTTSCGTSTASTLPITILPTPSIVSLGETTLCPVGGSIILLSTPASAYQWYKDNVLLPGETNQTYTATTAGAYTVVTSSGSCVSVTSAAFTVVMQDTVAPVFISPLGTQTTAVKLDWDVLAPVFGSNLPLTFGSGAASVTIRQSTPGGNAQGATTTPAFYPSTATAAGPAGYGEGRLLFLNNTGDPIRNLALTFPQSVTNLRFSVFDIDGRTDLQARAFNNGVLQSMQIDPTKFVAPNVTVTGSPGTTPTLNAPTGAFAITTANGFRTAGVNVVVAGPVNSLALASLTRFNGDSDIYLSDIYYDYTSAILPTDVTVNCDAIPAPMVLTATDNCSGSVTVSYTQTPAVYTPSTSTQIITRTWTATDGVGNSTTHTQTITVNPASATPTAPANQSICATVHTDLSSLTIVGTGIKWYADAITTTQLPITTRLTNSATYYATQTEVGNCESPRIPVTVELKNCSRINPNLRIRSAK
ncbi:MAG: DUF11 domain-containing protein [Chitinophagaceae bacterium]|nr:MAG: DUF11 domain-containing protein [Chitinophagaceae bacterium]